MLEFYLSGGSGNTSPALSLGGAKSATEVANDSVSYFSPDTVPGVTLLRASGLAPDTTGDSEAATLALIDGTPKLLWFSPRGYGPLATSPTMSNVVEVTANGQYLMTWDADGARQSLAVSVVLASLPGTNTTARLAVTRTGLSLFDSTTKDDSLTPVPEYRCCYVKNAGAAQVEAQVFLARTPLGAGISLGLDPIGVGGTAQTLTTETGTLTGVVFDSPDTPALGLPVTLPAGASVPLWLRRVVKPMLVQRIAGDSFVLGVSV